MNDRNAKLGRRRPFVLTVLSNEDGHHNYPNLKFRDRDVLYFASPELVFTVVPWEQPNEFGFSEIAWTSLGNIRFWGAIAFAIVEGQGFYSFYPLADRNLFFQNLADEEALLKLAKRTASEYPQPPHQLHWVKPDTHEILSLYQALQIADNALLRGVNCWLKSHMLWRHQFFMEEMGINLYIALEAGLSVLRNRLTQAAGQDVAFREVFNFVRSTFAHGDALAEFWQDAHDDRNALLHPDNDFSPHVIHTSAKTTSIYTMMALDPRLAGALNKAFGS
jgi:hypothetical protein